MSIKTLVFGLASFALLSSGLFTARFLQGQDDLADIIEKAEKSVLRIEVSGRGGGGLGSGYVVSEDGIFVTNVHVMAGADKAVAFFADGRSFEITGTYYIDENRDICVAQLKGDEEFEPIALADDLPRKGGKVIALGSPRGLSFSATTGIVSAIREEEEARQQLGRPNIEGTWIQVDAALSPGNSGGPLINERGEVVGMSTLASSGSSQNLNFGISIDDIKTGIKKGKDRRLTSLRDGVAKIDMDEVAPESGEVISRSTIPQSALDSYVERGKDQYSELAKDLRRSATKAASKLKEMRKGETHIPNGSGQYDIAVLEGRQADRYFFRNESVKRREVSRQQSLANKLGKIRKELTSKPNQDSLFALLMNGGPRLDVQSGDEIGFMNGGIVIQALNDHDVVIDYDGTPYLMWVKSTAGYSLGQSLTPAPVYVAGTQTVAVPGQGSISVTILNEVTETEIRKTIYGEDDEEESLDEFRTWVDNTGKYKIDAILVEVGASKVVLKKRDGSIITVPFTKLSEKDLGLLKKRN